MYVFENPSWQNCKLLLNCVTKEPSQIQFDLGQIQHSSELCSMEIHCKCWCIRRSRLCACFYYPYHLLYRSSLDFTFHPYSTNVPLLYPLKASFQGCRSGTLAENGLGLIFYKRLFLKLLSLEVIFVKLLKILARLAKQLKVSCMIKQNDKNEQRQGILDLLRVYFKDTHIWTNFLGCCGFLLMS